MEIVGMILGVLLLTGITVGAVNGTTKAGKALVAKHTAASAARKEARAKRKPLPNAEPAPAGIKAGAVAAGLVYGAALYGRAGWAGAKVGWDLGRERAIDWWEQRRPLAQDIDLGVTPEEYLAGKRPSPAPAAKAETPARPKRTAEDFARERRERLMLAAKSAVLQAEKQGYAAGDLEKAAVANLNSRLGHDYSQQSMTDAVRQILSGRQDNTQPQLRLAVDNTKSTTPTGGNPMAVHTVTGGEVTNVETGLAEAEAMLKRATTEFEDASADFHRAKEEFACANTFATSVTGLKFPENIKQSSVAFGEGARARMDAAQKRMQAAETQMNAARRLVTLFRGHRELDAMAASLGGMASDKAYSASRQ